MFKKLSALIISLLMTITICSVNALANETDNTNVDPANKEPNKVLMVNGINMVFGGKVLPAASDGSVKGANYDANKNTLTLNNYNGKSIMAGSLGDNFTIIANGTNYISGDKQSNGNGIWTYGKLTMAGSGTTNIIATSDFSSYNGAGSALKASAFNYVSGTLNITATEYAIDSINAAFGIYINDGEGGGDMVVSGGSINVGFQEKKGNSASFGVLADNIEVSGTGLLKAQSGLALSSGSGAVCCYNAIVVKDYGRIEAIGGICASTGVSSISAGIVFFGSLDLYDHGSIYAVGNKASQSHGIDGRIGIETSASSSTPNLSLSKAALIHMNYHGGSLIALTNSSDDANYAINNTVNIDSQVANVLWRSDANSAFTLNNQTEYINNSANAKYNEIRDNVEVESSLNHLNLDGDNTALLGKDYRATLKVTDNNYQLPSSIKVSINGKVLTSGYTYNPSTGLIIISADKLNGTLVIEASGVSKAVVTPTKGNADSPLTADHSQMMLWLTLLLGSATLLTLRKTIKN